MFVGESLGTEVTPDELEFELAELWLAPEEGISAVGGVVFVSEGAEPGASGTGTGA